MENYEIKFHFPPKDAGVKTEWDDLAENVVHIELKMNCRTGEIVDVHIDCPLIRLAHVLSVLKTLMVNIGVHTLEELRVMSEKTVDYKVDWKAQL